MRHSLQGFTASLRRFPPTFWLINLVELLERGAYYGMLAVFSYHLVKNLGFSESLTGILIAFHIPLLYFVPVIAGPLSKKYGYKRSLVALFLLLATGYLLLGSTSSAAVITLGIFTFGVGAGIFKPIVASTVSHTSPDDAENLGFSLYYWMINAGAFLTPLLIGFTIPEHLYRYVFFLAAGLIGLNLLLVYLFFEDPVDAEPDQTLTEALSELKTVLADRQFTVLLLLYSGFWFVYAMNHVILPLYMVDFVDMPDRFQVAWLGTVNPGTIILAGPIVSKLVEDKPSLPLMIVGILVFCLGFAMVGFFPTAILFLTGIVVASVGEFVTHPSFISHVSKTAPDDQTETYMGYIFLPVGIGYFAGSAVGGLLYEAIALQASRPTLFWGVVTSVALLSLISMLAYHRWADADGTTEQLSAAPGRLIEHRATIAAAGLLVPILLGGTYLAGQTDPLSATDRGDALGSNGSREIATFEGYLAEGDTHLETIPTGTTNTTNLTLRLTWEDEPPPASGPPGATANQPDEFRLRLIHPNGTASAWIRQANQPGQQAHLVLDTQVTFDRGDHRPQAVVELLEAGDRTVGGIASPGMSDEGNDWSLVVTATEPTGDHERSAPSR